MTTKHNLAAKCYNKNGKLLSSATNSYSKTHPLQAMFAKSVGLDMKQYLHAEIHAIISARGAKNPFVTRNTHNKAGKLA